MLDLKKDAHTVSGLSFRVLSRPVLQVLYDLKSSRHRAVALFPFNINDRADTAVVMFKALAVQPLLVLIRLINTRSPIFRNLWDDYTRFFPVCK